MTVADAGVEPPISFPNQVVPIFTKAGCNAGGCHGKASGQNGFKLSLLGFDARFDYDAIVKEARGRRVFPARSRTEPAAAQGDRRGAARGRPEDRARIARVRALLRAGSRRGRRRAPARTRLVRIECTPKDRLARPARASSRFVTAYYSDGSTAT